MLSALATAFCPARQSTPLPIPSSSVGLGVRWIGCRPRFTAQIVFTWIRMSAAVRLGAFSRYRLSRRSTLSPAVRIVAQESGSLRIQTALPARCDRQTGKAVDALVDAHQRAGKALNELALTDDRYLMLDAKVAQILAHIDQLMHKNT